MFPAIVSQFTLLKRKKKSESRQVNASKESFIEKRKSREACATSETRNDFNDLSNYRMVSSFPFPLFLHSSFPSVSELLSECILDASPSVISSFELWGREGNYRRASRKNRRSKRFLDLSPRAIITTERIRSMDFSDPLGWRTSKWRHTRGWARMTHGWMPAARKGIIRLYNRTTLL